MDLYPQDLRSEQLFQIVQQRSLANAGTPQTSAPAAMPARSRRLGRLGNLWRRGTSLTEEETSVAIAANRPLRIGLQVLPISLVTSLSIIPFVLTAVLAPGALPEVTTGIGLAWAGTFYGSLIALPRALLRGVLCKPITDAEASALISRSDDDLSQSFLHLVRSIASTTVPVEAQEDLRTAVRMLAAALDALPDTPNATLDATELRQQSAALRTEVLSETDPVIADSITNRADALERRANAAERSQTRMRRIAALRAEIEAQIGALRDEVIASGVAGAGTAADSTALASLADAAKRVAFVARSAADARAELDAFTTGLSKPLVAAVQPKVSTPSPTVEDAPAVLRARRG